VQSWSRLPWPALPLAPLLTRAKKPNIALIVSDDQGYADVGVQGCKEAKRSAAALIRAALSYRRPAGGGDRLP
jgi:hypothetical protein